MRSGRERCSDLLRDIGLVLGESDVMTRLVFDELHINLPPLTAWLIIIFDIVAASRSADARTLDAAVVSIQASVASATEQAIVVSRG